MVAGREIDRLRHPPLGSHVRVPRRVARGDLPAAGGNVHRLTSFDTLMSSPDLEPGRARDRHQLERSGQRVGRPTVEPLPDRTRWDGLAEQLKPFIGLMARSASGARIGTPTARGDRVPRKPQTPPTFDLRCAPRVRRRRRRRASGDLRRVHGKNADIRLETWTVPASIERSGTLCEDGHARCWPQPR